MLNQMLNPMTAWALGGAGLALALFLALYLFCTLKVEIRAAGRRAAHPVTADLDDLKRRLDDIESRSAAASLPAGPGECSPADASPVPVRASMNLSRRSQALRLSRRGESPEQIASRLGLATGEVRLLLKIHGVLVEQATRGPRPSEDLKFSLASADMSGSACNAARAMEPR